MAAAVVPVSVTVGAGGPVGRTAGGIGQGAEVVVEGMVLLHQHDDVLDLAEVAVGASAECAEQREEENCRTCPRLLHKRCPPEAQRRADSGGRGWRFCSTGVIFRRCPAGATRSQKRGDRGTWRV